MSDRDFVAETLFVLAMTAWAGPPLVCHAFDIGGAKSLPWTGDSWNLTGNESYDTKHLAGDTIAILDGDSTVLVHMETLRRFGFTELRPGQIVQVRWGYGSKGCMAAELRPDGVPPFPPPH